MQNSACRPYLCTTMKLKNTMKRLFQDTQYMAALERQNELLKENLKKEKDDKTADELEQYRRRSRSYLRPVNEMTEWMLENYDFRYNIVTDVFEFRRKGEVEYTVVDKYAVNSIAIEVQEAGIFVRDHFVERLIKSKYAQAYHPVREYIGRVRGTWDGKDRVGDFLRRISSSEYCLHMGRIWLRAMVAQMAGLDSEHANSVMLLIVSPQQGLHKSTFMRSLLPKELKDYYTDDFSLGQKGNAQRKIVEFAIVNVDEMDKENPKKMPMMKTLMQTMKPSFIGAYKKSFNRLPRIASFVGTSNSRELLTDHSGSRRFLILEPDGMIDVGGIEHDQIYAQLLHEAENGEPYFFSKEEEGMMNEHNVGYYKKSQLERDLSSFFRRDECVDKPERGMSCEDVMKVLRMRKVKGADRITANALGRTLTRLFGRPVHTKLGNLYPLILI